MDRPDAHRRAGGHDRRGRGGACPAAGDSGPSWPCSGSWPPAGCPRGRCSTGSPSSWAGRSSSRRGVLTDLVGFALLLPVSRRWAAAPGQGGTRTPDSRRDRPVRGVRGRRHGHHRSRGGAHAGFALREPAMSRDIAFLERLLEAPGPSGFESRAAQVWMREAETFAEVWSDVVGNSYAGVRPETRPLVLLAGHIDEIGLQITHVARSGLLYFAGIGGWDPQVLVGQRVRVLGARGDVPGVIGRKAIHLIEPKEREKAAKVKKLVDRCGGRVAGRTRGDGGARGRSGRAGRRDGAPGGRAGGEPGDRQPGRGLRRAGGAPHRSRAGGAGGGGGGGDRAGGDRVFGGRGAHQRLRSLARRGAGGRRDPRHRRARGRQERGGGTLAGRRAGADPGLGDPPGGLRGAGGNCRSAGHPLFDPGRASAHRHGRRRHSPGPAAECPPAWCRCRTGTCIRPARWWPSPTSSTRRNCLPRSWPGLGEGPDLNRG